MWKTKDCSDCDRLESRCEPSRVSLRVLHRSSSVGWSRQKLPCPGYRRPELGLTVYIYIYLVLKFQLLLAV